MQDLIIYLLVWRNLSYYQYLIETTHFLHGDINLCIILLLVYCEWDCHFHCPLAVELLCLVNGGTKLIGTSNDGHAWELCRWATQLVSLLRTRLHLWRHYIKVMGGVLRLLLLRASLVDGIVRTFWSSNARTTLQVLPLQLAVSVLPTGFLGSLDR